MPSDFQRAFSGGLRQDCSRFMALGVRRGEITLAVRPSSGHCSRIWRSSRKKGSEGSRNCPKTPQLCLLAYCLSPHFLSVPHFLPVPPDTGVLDSVASPSGLLGGFVLSGILA